MADGSGTRTPASIWFVAHGETALDVTQFAIHEGMNSLFAVHVTATCTDGALDLSKIVGEGGAFRFKHHSGDLVWAGICAEASQLVNQPHGAAAVSAYRFVIVPAMWRTTLRRNNRIFERMTLPKIVGKILDEWQIPYDDKKLKETYREQDFRVQYDETDFAFMSRLLEEAGISYWFDSDVGSGPGSAVTSVIFGDQPQGADPLPGAFPYRATGRNRTFRSGENVVFDVVIGERMRFGKATIADFDILAVPHTKIVANAQVTGEEADKEAVYEDYQHVGAAFLALPGGGSSSRVADDKGAVRVTPEEAKDRTQRELEAARHGRYHVEMSTTALDLAPGHVFAIGQNSQESHPNPDVSAERRLLIIGRRMSGTTNIEHSFLEAVPADVPHRPERKTPRQRIHGVQSALVVGPNEQEIHTDELGRVRVQFHWDREHSYDAESSCWMRVSQGWAGTGFGLINIPRVGQEVVVSFHDGDPDVPVIIGRLFNKTSAVPYKLPENKTKSGWRSESSGGDSRSGAARGYNELMFEDAIGREAVSLRAEQSLGTLVKASETLNVGKTRMTHVKTNDALSVGEMAETIVGQKTGIQLKSAGEITISTTEASIVLRGDDIEIEATEVGAFRAGGRVHLSAAPGAAVFLRGGKEVHINPHTAGDRNPHPVELGKAQPPGGGPPIAAPYYPVASGAAPAPPGPFPEIQVKNGEEAPAAPPAAKAKSPKEEEAAAKAKPSATPPANPCAGLGSATPGAMRALNTSVKALQSRWPDMTTDQRTDALRGAINDHLAGAGVPPVNLKPASGDNSGSFDWRTWELSINNAFLDTPKLSSAGAQTLSGLLAHEGRHAEQFYLMARKLSRDDPGRPPAAAAAAAGAPSASGVRLDAAAAARIQQRVKQALGIPASVAAKAVDEPLSGGPQAECATRVHQSVFGSGAAARNETFQEMGSKDPAVSEKAFDKYRLLPEEHDASESENRTTADWRAAGF